MINSSETGLFPIGSELVVLDTNVFREMGETQPSWIQAFQLMSRNGYAFSISDLGFAELGHQFTSGKVTLEVFSKAIELADTFVFADVPVLPSKSDIMGMIGSRSAKRKYDSTEIAKFSTNTWERLKSLANLSDVDKKVECDKFLKMIEEDRKHWREFFDKKAGDPDIQSEGYLQRQFTDLDTIPCDPPIPSTRFDFKMRHIFRKSLHFQKAKDPYNPHGSKKKNDGLDDDLLHYLALPAYLITFDGGLHSAATDIASFQSKWILKPEDLASAWENRTLAPLQWPESPPNVAQPIGPASVNLK